MAAAEKSIGSPLDAFKEADPQQTFQIRFSERHGQVVNTPAPYFDIPGSYLGPKTGYPN
jgi:hypothetical protein